MYSTQLHFELMGRITLKYFFDGPYYLDTVEF